MIDLSIRYYKTADNKWFKQEWAPQCDQTVFIIGKCQGTHGHPGEHWEYAKDGSYRWADNDSDPSSKRDKRGVAGMTPPEDKEWVSPKDKVDAFYVKFSSVLEVLDPEKIAELEADEYEEEAMIDKPCSAEEIKWLRDNGRLDDLDLDEEDENDLDL